MKISVFPRGSNPVVDRHIQRKSLSYCEAEVEARRADWVDPEEPLSGIICREFLCFGQKLTPAAPEQVQNLSLRSALPPMEIRTGKRIAFDDPIKTSEKKQNRSCLLVRARAFAHYCDLEAFAQAQA